MFGKIPRREISYLTFGVRHAGREDSPPVMLSFLKLHHVLIFLVILEDHITRSHPSVCDLAVNSKMASTQVEATQSIPQINEKFFEVSLGNLLRFPFTKYRCIHCIQMPFTASPWGLCHRILYQSINHSFRFIKVL